MTYGPQGVKLAGVPKRKAVNEWFATYENPMKAVVMRVRDIVLGSDERVDECIKWQAPTFVFEGNIASFFPKSKQHASLMFHDGASIPGKHPRLEGSAEKGRVLKIASLAEAEEAKAEIEAIVRAWCAWKGTTSPRQRRTTSRPARRSAATARPRARARRARAS